MRYSAIMIHELELKIPLTLHTTADDGSYAIFEAPFSTDRDQILTFELLNENGLVTGIKKRVNPQEALKTTLEERMEKFNILHFNHMDLHQVGGNDFIIVMKLNPDASNRRYIKEKRDRLAGSVPPPIRPNPPVITQHPQSQQITLGPEDTQFTNINPFQVTATGDGDLTFTWSLRLIVPGQSVGSWTQQLSGIDEYEWNINPLDVYLNGAYYQIRVTVSNAGGSVTSEIVSLTGIRNVDWSTLEATIAEAESRNESDYYAWSWTPLADIYLPKAINFRNVIQTYPRQSDIDDMVTKLQAAIDGLVEITQGPGPEPLDWSALKTAISVAQTKNAADYYTLEFTAMTTLVSTLAGIINDEYDNDNTAVTQSSIDGWTQDLTDAINALRTLTEHGLVPGDLMPGNQQLNIDPSILNQFTSVSLFSKRIPACLCGDRNFTVTHEVNINSGQPIEPNWQPIGLTNVTLEPSSKFSAVSIDAVDLDWLWNTLNLREMPIEIRITTKCTHGDLIEYRGNRELVVNVSLELNHHVENHGIDIVTPLGHKVVEFDDNDQIIDFNFDDFVVEFEDCECGNDTPTVVLEWEEVNPINGDTTWQDLTPMLSHFHRQHNSISTTSIIFRLDDSSIYQLLLFFGLTLPIRIRARIFCGTEADYDYMTSSYGSLDMKENLEGWEMIGTFFPGGHPAVIPPWTPVPFSEFPDYDGTQEFPMDYMWEFPDNQMPNRYGTNNDFPDAINPGNRMYCEYQWPVQMYYRYTMHTEWVLCPYDMICPNGKSRVNSLSVWGCMDEKTAYIGGGSNATSASIDIKFVFDPSAKDNFTL